MKQRDSESRNGIPLDGAAHMQRELGSESKAAAGHSECATDGGAAHAPRTQESLRAEEAYRAWSQAPASKRQLAAHHITVAALLRDVLKAHDVSKLRFAAMIGVDKKTVQKWLTGEAPTPLAVLLGLPTEMSLDFIERLSALRGVRGGMGFEIAKLRRTRNLDAIHVAQDELTALAREIGRGR